MTILELEDIQGYVIRGYGHLHFSRFALLNFEDAGLVKQWINELITDITPATHIINKTELPYTALNIAFTSNGLSDLGIIKENMQRFNPEFREGIVTEHRQRILGDFGSSAPENWRWGGPGTKPVQVILMVFGTNQEIGMAYYETLQKSFSKYGLTELQNLDGLTLNKNREHFGFRDGISQPVVKGSGKAGPKNDEVNPGEFILGYKNEYNVYPDSPILNKEQGDMNLLATDAGGSGLKDLGRNGSYLVIRQLEQNVKGFWEFMNEKTKNEDGSINEAESLKLAARFIGRWQSGAPLTKFPDTDPGIESDDNDFGYAKKDADGLKCPLGSHLRRCNPRDSFEDDSKKESVKLSNRHRIIRRGRLYGDPYEGSPTNTSPNGEVGLIFGCFNADISRQFELIQHTWANSTKTKQMYNDPDPIIGVLEQTANDKEQNFTIQACPVNKTISGLKSFVTVRGGAYFFLPSITALRYLTTI